MSTDHHPASQAGVTEAPSGAGVSDPSAILRPDAPHAVGPMDPVELDLAKGALKAIAVLSLPVLGFAWLAAGTGGLLGAGIAIATVGGMYLISGAMLSFAAKLGPGALMAAALGGFAMRLMIYALMIVLLRPVDAIHGPSLAISAAVLIVLSLIWEARIVSRTPHLLWIDASAAHARPVAQLPSTPHPTPEPSGHPA